MTSRRRNIASALIAAAVLVPASALAGTVDLTDLPQAGGVYATIHAPHCSQNGARTLAANRRSRVFETRERSLACLRSANRAYVIGNPRECQNGAEIDTAVVADTFAAINVRTCSLTHTRSGIALVNLRNGHVVFSSDALTTRSLEGQTDAIRAMVLTPKGRVAWLALRRGTTTRAIEVRRRAHGPNRQSVLLDSATNIDPRSLRRRGARVFWTKAGAKQSAWM